MVYILIPVFIVIFPPLMFFLYLTLTEYRPDKIEETIRYRKTKDNQHFSSYNILTYNIGFCANDKYTKKSNLSNKYSIKIDRETVYDNLIAITNMIKDADTEFTLLQEVDQSSSRSGDVDQIEFIASEVKDMNTSFAFNFNAKYIPFPLNHPVGGTYSGLLQMSKYPALKSERHQLDGHESFPRSMFHLKRCMIVEEFQLKKKKLIVINVHFSSYDKASLFRTEQFFTMFRYIESMYDPKVNAIIVGGDFNYLLNQDDLELDTPHWLERFPEELYNSDFKPVYPKVGKTMLSDGKEYSVDGFIVSNNVKVNSCDIVNDQFAHSNHNPVKMNFKI